VGIIWVQLMAANERKSTQRRYEGDSKDQFVEKGGNHVECSLRDMRGVEGSHGERFLRAVGFVQRISVNPEKNRASEHNQFE